MSKPSWINSQWHVSKELTIQDIVDILICEHTKTPGFWLLRAEINVQFVFPKFCSKWSRPRGKSATSPAYKWSVWRTPGTKVKNFTLELNIKDVITIVLLKFQSCMHPKLNNPISLGSIHGYKAISTRGLDLKTTTSLFATKKSTILARPNPNTYLYFCKTLSTKNRSIIIYHWIGTWKTCQAFYRWRWTKQYSLC